MQQPIKDRLEHREETVETSTQTEKKNRWSAWFTRLLPGEKSAEEMAKLNTKVNEQLLKTNKEVENGIETEDTGRKESDEEQDEEQPKPGCSGEIEKGRDWTYTTEDNRYMLATLEDPQTLTIALRHVVRKQYDNGERITFSVPDAVARISLR